MATRHLARFLAKAGHRVVVAGALTEQERIVDNVEYWDTGPSYDLNAVFERAKQLGNYHFIGANSPKACQLATTQTSVQSILLILHSQPASSAGLIANELNDVCDKIVMVSKAQADLYIQQGTAPDKIKVIHNGVDLEIFNNLVPAERNLNNIVFAGALVKDKGLGVLLPAFAKLKSHYPNLTLSIYGSAGLWNRESIFDERGIEQAISGVKFYGAQPQAIIADAYRRSGFAVMPSIWFESFGLSSIEAQACGCPVVAFNVGGIRETIVQGKSGLVLEQVSQDSLELGLAYMLEDRDRLRRMSEFASINAKRSFSWEKVANQIADLSFNSSRATVTPASNKSKRKVAILSTWNQPCGLATYAKFLTSNYSEDTYIILAEDSNQLTAKDECFVRRCWNRNHSDYTAIKKHILDNSIGILHLNLHFDFVRSSGKYRFFAASDFHSFLKELKSNNVKIITTLHSAFTNDAAFAEFIKLNDLVLVHTHEVRLEVIANSGVPEKVRVIEHGVNVLPPLTISDRFNLRTKLNVPNNEKIIVSFGFVQPHKGMEAVLSAVHYLNQRGIKTSGYILGQPNPADPNSSLYLQKLRQAAHELNLSTAINFIDRFIEDSEVSEYLQVADLVIMNYQSQHYEASGACSLAIGAGAIIATSLAPVFSAFGPAVWHMTSGYPPELSAWNLIVNNELRHAIHQKRLEYCSKYNWPNIAKRIEDLYKEITAVNCASIQSDTKMDGACVADQSRSKSCKQLNPKPQIEIESSNAVDSLDRSKEVQGDSMQVEQELAVLEDSKRLRQYENLLVECDNFQKKHKLTSEQQERLDLLTAEIYGLTGDYLLAEERFKSILGRNPSSARAYSGLGALAAAKQDWDKAAQFFQQALQKNSACDSALAGLGICANNLKDFDSAWKYFSHALNLNCENKSALIGALEIGYATKRYSELENLIRKYLDLHPADKSFVFSLAGCLYQQDKIIDALEQVEKLKFLDPTSHDAVQLEKLINNKKMERAKNANH